MRTRLPRQERSLRLYLLLAVVGTACGLAVWPAKAETKDYYFPEVRVEIAVEPDGSFSVDEFRTYDFEGHFSWASLWIPTMVERSGYSYSVSIEGFRVLDSDGRPLQTEVAPSDRKFEAKWHFQARNERRIFHIQYRVRGGIISYADASELYWQVIGDDWDRPTEKVAVTAVLPEAVGSKDDILVYGHGPLSGWSEIVDNRVARFTAANLPAYQFLEIRLVWPAGLVAGVPSSRHTRASIKQEEARFVQQTIERIRQSQEEEQRKPQRILKLVTVWVIWLAVSSLAWLFIYIRTWKKVGQDYGFQGLPEYYRDLPSDLRPALVEVLLKEGGAISPRSFTATLFDLARRGYVELEDQEVEKQGLFGTKEEIQTAVTLKKEYASDPGLLPYERDVLELLFETVVQTGKKPGARFNLDELKKYLKKKPQKFQTWYRGWAKKVDGEAKRLQFIEPKSIRSRNVFLAATIPLAVLTLNPILGVLAAFFIPKIKRRSEHWARENELWKSLDRFLDDFSDFEELPAEAYKLWEHYLVFGILFGNAKKILKMLPIILKDERATIPVWYLGVSRSGLAAPGRIAGLVKSIESASSSIHAAATSAAHYSSGRGGGFSGGGGGGGRAG